MAGRVQCIGTDGHRPGQKAGNRGGLVETGSPENVDNR